MSKIKIFALGGLNENGKNMYVVEVDKDILVIDAGLRYADETMLGIDYLIPNIEYLKENKKRIKGIFLTHGHDENIGALSDIVKDLEGINIYASKFTMDIVRKEFETSKLSTDNLVEIPAYKTINLGNISVFPVNLSHSIPDNFGYAIYTKDGVIFFASDFVFDAMMRGHYQTDIGKLAYIGKQGVLCLMTESVYADKRGHTAPNHRISNLIRETFGHAQGRIIFNVLNSHLYRIQELFNEVSKTDKKIVIMGKRLQNIINDAMENKYLHIDKKFIGDLSNINDKNVVIINSNEREKPYSNIMKIVSGYDKFIKLKEDDTVFLATPVYEGREKTYYKLLDDISKQGVDVVSLPPSKYLSHHASSEDLMMMIDLMRPKYYFPVKGEYRLQVANAELASKVGINDNNILLKENGDVITFVNGKLVENYEKVPCGFVSIDGDSSDDVGEVVLKDREMLSDNGIVIISATINKKSKEILAGPEILTRGFVYVKDSTLLIDEMKSICLNIIKNNTHNNYIEYNKIKNTIRDELSKYLVSQTGCKPMIITVIQEI
jgi:ribonuclease J